MPQKAKMIFCVHSDFNKKNNVYTKIITTTNVSISDITSGLLLPQCSEWESKWLEVMSEIEASQFTILYQNY